MLKESDVIPGVTLDRGLVPLYGSKNETTSQGLDDLDERCKKYYQDGLRFAKFRAAFSINSEKGIPTLPETNQTADMVAPLNVEVEHFGRGGCLHFLLMVISFSHRPVRSQAEWFSRFSRRNI